MKEELFEPIKLFGKLVLFTPKRINEKDVPEGLYKYEVRHDDDDTGIMCQIAEFILVNHWGTILSIEPIDLGEVGIRNIDDEEDVENFGGHWITISQYKEQLKNGGIL